MKIGKRMDTIEGFLFSEVRESLSLIETEGKTIPYKNSFVPKILRKPLIVSDKGEIKGWKSGGRSALVYYRGKWYDLEGVKPSGKEWVPGVPEGGDTKLEAENELKAGALFSKYGKKNNIPALTEPICLFEYSKIKFKEEPVYASVLETKGDLRLSYFLGTYLTAAEKAYNRLKDDPSREAKIDQIINKIKAGLTNKIGQWVGFWYRCLDENNLLWGTSYEKKPDKMYILNSNAGNNNLTLYRLNDRVAVSIVDLNGLRTSEEKSKSLEIDRIKKRLSIFEMTLYILKRGRSGMNISQYQVLQTWASKLYKEITPPKGINIYQEQYGYDPFEELGLPKIDDLDIIASFNDGRRGIKPELIEETCVTNIYNMFWV